MPCAAPLPCLHGVRHVLLWVCFQPVAHDSSVGPVCRERHILRAPRLLLPARTANPPRPQHSADSAVHTQVNNAAFPCEHPPPVSLFWGTLSAGAGGAQHYTPVQTSVQKRAVCTSSLNATQPSGSARGPVCSCLAAAQQVATFKSPCLHDLYTWRHTSLVHTACGGGGRWTQEAENLEPDAPCRRTFSRMTANTIQLEVPVRPDGYSDLIELAMPQARTCAVCLWRVVLLSRTAAVRRMRAG